MVRAPTGGGFGLLIFALAGYLRLKAEASDRFAYGFMYLRLLLPRFRNMFHLRGSHPLLRLAQHLALRTIFHPRQNHQSRRLKPAIHRPHQIAAVKIKCHSLRRHLNGTNPLANSVPKAKTRQNRRAFAQNFTTQSKPAKQERHSLCFFTRTTK